MQYLHSRNIIHGGLETSDILAKEDGHPCIADYGIENHRYFSPEAWKGVSNTNLFGFLFFSRSQHNPKIFYVFPSLSFPLSISSVN
ncbi:hypothetical protein K435DRAFT_900211 [Dendrothele bispora CBS 962.96]|uniref:Protein kinase domain-containing protein n=1 Tax=Dendrothele bispora (strain CBS 962.96) TaxID=1314807 RepID=A0A4S8LYA1_DENBC|nr:hypothetical protein K435DRAFT_900211 [Dendrothele bispora CBS 962.96]